MKYKFDKNRRLIDESGTQIIQIIQSNCSEKERIRIGKILEKAKKYLLRICRRLWMQTRN